LVHVPATAFALQLPAAGRKLELITKIPFVFVFDTVGGSAAAFVGGRGVVKGAILAAM
jgi:hypothetical protein